MEQCFLQLGPHCVCIMSTKAMKKTTTKHGSEKYMIYTNYLLQMLCMYAVLLELYKTIFFKTTHFSVHQLSYSLLITALFVQQNYV